MQGNQRESCPQIVVEIDSFSADEEKLQSSLHYFQGEEKEKGELRGEGEK